MAEEAEARAAEALVVHGCALAHLAGSCRWRHLVLAKYVQILVSLVPASAESF